MSARGDRDGDIWTGMAATIALEAGCQFLAFPALALLRPPGLPARRPRTLVTVFS